MTADEMRALAQILDDEAGMAPVSTYPNANEWRAFATSLRAHADEVEAMREDAAIGALVRSKMVSGNSIPVERCTIRKDEIDAARNPPVTAKSDCGHGHVYPRADGAIATCGGPGICPMCSIDAARKEKP